MLANTSITMHAAEKKKESRGTHTREDFDSRDDENWMMHTVAYFDPKTHKTKIDYRPTHQNSLDENEQKPFPPQARVY